MVLDIKIDDMIVPPCKNKKILGVTFDPLLTLNQHTKNVKNKIEAKNNVLKTLAGTTIWERTKKR